MPLGDVAALPVNDEDVYHFHETISTEVSNIKQVPIAKTDTATTGVGHRHADVYVMYSLQLDPPVRVVSSVVSLIDRCSDFP